MFKVVGLHVFARRVFLCFLDADVSSVTPMYARENVREGGREGVSTLHGQ